MRKSKEKILLVDIEDLLEEMDVACISYGEIPLHRQYNENFDAFLFDIYHAIGYLPLGPEAPAANIEEVLDQCGSYYDEPKFTIHQSQLWRRFAQRLIERMWAMKLYDSRQAVNMYDYRCYANNTLYLTAGEL